MRWIVLVFCLLVTWTTAFAEEQAPDDDVLARLKALPGVEVFESTTGGDRGRGLRRFLLQVSQPIDHFARTSKKFKQKVVLFHRSFAEPMVLQTSGYAIFAEALGRLAVTFSANQLQVEHRYFAGSAPDPKDWSKLTVRQSAEDFHRIVQLLKPLYAGRWVNTGSSKGGMTSVFHRHFYPDDLDGTVADVAPFSVTTADPRYIDFMEKVGGEKYAECRQRLDAVQATLLRRRAEIVPSLQGDYSMMGGADVAFESAVIELPFVFWQYGNPQGWGPGCLSFPRADDSALELRAFLDSVNSPGSYTNSRLTMFQPYYFQSAVELGNPGAKLSHLRELMKFPYVIDPLLPKGVEAKYSDLTVRSVRAWAANQAKKVIFVYGEYDPWTAGAFPLLKGNADNHQFIVSGANHLATIFMLQEREQKEAIAILERWFGKAASSRALDALATGEPLLEELEFEALKKARLP